MKNINVLIENLKSPHSSIRDSAAVDLMVIGDITAVEPLIEAIRVPENVNHRGTLVYALSEFDCADHLRLLVDLVVTGNFEVTAGTLQILEKTSLSEYHVAKLRSLVNDVDTSKLTTEHHRNGYKSLTELLQ